MPGGPWVRTLPACSVGEDALQAMLDIRLAGWKPAPPGVCALLSMDLTPNSTLSHYRIIAKIGAGGMGEVYRGEDPRLERRVALKILPAEFTRDEDRVRRFVQEAKAASALNHPNIVTIYEIGESDGTHFIATEFIEGQTLRQIMSSGKLPLKLALDVATQTAFALTAAHESGIIHRDIKPENVMLRPDGVVKVVDFGLAKLTESRTAPFDPEAPTAMQVNTDPGKIMGTVQYMSPEQARGLAVDARTDLFSLGVLLHEMIAGCLPFTGETASHVLVAILEKEAPPLTQSIPGVPAELERIVTKVLVKDRNERYQSARDLMIDLKRLRARQEIDEERGRLMPESPNVEGSPSSGKISEPSSTPLQNSSERNVSARSVSSAEYLVGGITRHARSVLLISLLLIVSAGGLLYFFFGGSGAALSSIAIMPFVNETGNPEMEYLSDGMTEALIGSLSQLRDLNVKARSSVFRYKNKATDARTIGKELDVEAILNGRVTQRGDQMTFSLELINAKTENVIWTERYERKEANLVLLQSEIARDVSTKLKTKLTNADEAKVAKTYTTNPEAYQLYLNGNYYKAKYTEEGYKKALEYFQKAIEKDPDYALAHAAIAYTYNFASDFYLAPHEVMPKVKAAALKALELDETLAGAHLSIGTTAFWYERDWATAERSFKRSMELDPAYAHREYATYLNAMGRLEESIREGETAIKYSPLDLAAYDELAWCLIDGHRYDEALATARKAIELDANYWGGHQMSGLAYERKGKFPEAILALEKARSLDRNPWIVAILGYVYATAGKKAEAHKVLSELQEISKVRWVSPYNIAIIYAGLNEKDLAFEFIDKAFEARSIVSMLKVDPFFDNLRNDPRFNERVKRLNLPE